MENIALHEWYAGWMFHWSGILGKRAHMTENSSVIRNNPVIRFRWDVNMSNASWRSSYDFLQISFLGAGDVWEEVWFVCFMKVWGHWVMVIQRYTTKMDETLTPLFPFFVERLRVGKLVKYETKKDVSSEFMDWCEHLCVTWLRRNKSDESTKNDILGTTISRHSNTF